MPEQRYLSRTRSPECPGSSRRSWTSRWRRARGRDLRRRALRGALARGGAAGRVGHSRHPPRGRRSSIRPCTSSRAPRCWAAPPVIRVTLSGRGESASRRRRASWRRRRAAARANRRRRLRRPSCTAGASRRERLRPQGRVTPSRGSRGPCREGHAARPRRSSGPSTSSTRSWGLIGSRSSWRSRFRLRPARHGRVDDRRRHRRRRAPHRLAGRLLALRRGYFFFFFFCFLLLLFLAARPRRVVDRPCAAGRPTVYAAADATRNTRRTTRPSDAHGEPGHPVQRAARPPCVPHADRHERHEHRDEDDDEHEVERDLAAPPTAPSLASHVRPWSLP